MTVKAAAQTSKKNKAAAKTAAAKTAAAKTAAVKNVSNTQKCADMIMQLAKAAKYTRNEIVTSVSEALSALSIVTVKTMISDLQNSKYAKRYSSHTIAIDKSTKIVTVNAEIKA